MSERRPRLNKKLNSKDKNATVRIMAVLLRISIAVPPKSRSNYIWNKSKRKATFGMVASRVFSKGREKVRKTNSRKFGL